MVDAKRMMETDEMVLNVSFSYYTFFSNPWFIRDNERTG